MMSRPLTAEEFDRLAIFAHEAAIAIKNAQLFAEVERLKNRLQAENLYLRSIQDGLSRNRLVTRSDSRGT